MLRTQVAAAQDLHSTRTISSYEVDLLYDGRTTASLCVVPFVFC